MEKEEVKEEEVEEEKEQEENHLRKPCRVSDRGHLVTLHCEQMVVIFEKLYYC